MPGDPSDKTDRPLLPSRLGRLGRLASMGARSGLRRLAGRKDEDIARLISDQLGSLRGLALKVGQMASYVDGLVPEGRQEIYEQALAKLRSQAATMSPEAAARVVAAELGRAPETLFETWEPRPFASASIGQVHRATLSGGRAVAVKVQYEGVEAAVHADLANAGLLGSLLGPLGGKFGLKDQLTELRARFNEELDYQHEAEVQRHFGQIFEGDLRVRIPAVVTDRSARRVLTTELVSGRSFEEAMAASEPERRAWAETLFRFVFSSVLWKGTLNADPHPGNYLMGDDGLVHFLDFGCTRTLPPPRLEIARRAHLAASAGDERAFLDWSLKLVAMVPGTRQATLAEEHIRTAFLPILTRGGFRVTREMAALLMTQIREQALHLAKSKGDEACPLPPDMLFFNRLQLGFYSVLARLDVEADYHGVHEQIVKRIPR